jgi:multidrug transporter EmrE-like cation transporter
MTPRLLAGLLVSVIGLVLLARVALALLPWGLALAAWVGLGGAFVLLVRVCLGSTED